MHVLKSGSNDQHEPGDNNDNETSDEGISAALVEDLTAHRTAALRAVLQLRIASPNHRSDRGSEAPNFIAAQLCSRGSGDVDLTFCD